MARHKEVQDDNQVVPDQPDTPSPDGRPTLITPEGPLTHERPGAYRITIRGHLDSHWSAWFEGLTITNAPNGEATLTGQVVDQAALHGLLVKIRDLGLPLIAVVPGSWPENDGAGSADDRE